MQISELRMQMLKILKDLWAIRNTCLVIGVPVILSPLAIIINTKEASCAYAVLIMAIYWMTEAIPLAVTALFPAVLFPILGVLSAKEVSMQFLKDINMLFVGGLAVALAVENSNLHKRIALRVLMTVGSSASRLMFGFLFVTAFLSMWISNTACAAMMLPIAEAVLQELHKHYSQHYTKVIPQMHDPSVVMGGGTNLSAPPGMRSENSSAHLIELHNIKDHSDNELEEDETEKEVFEYSPPSEKEKNIAKGILLCVCYGANIGGTGTLTGTGPNLILQGEAGKLGGKNSITFASWFGFAFPGMVVTLFFAWFWIQFLFIGWRSLFDCCRRTKTPLEINISRVIKEKYEELGQMSFFEGIVLANFIVLVILWFFRKPGFMPGWGAVFLDGYVSDSTCALFIMILLFIFPRNKPKILCFRSHSDPNEVSVQPGILKWEDMGRFPWGIVILLGGGFAMADGVDKSGLGLWIGKQLESFQGVPPIAMVVLCATIVAAVTEVASNTATISIFLPILKVLARTLKVHPLYLMVPATLAASFAFMFPVATPPNAIVFATGRLRVLDMMKCGFMMNVICVLIVSFATITYGHYIFDFNVDHVRTENVTTTTTELP